jgi:protein O-GlcNAc transferase
VDFDAEKVLLRAIELHQNGRLEEAERHYRSILEVQPTHPDANHNLGVLAVGVNKPEAALPFLEKALQNNPSVSQFWLSYIDALIKVGKFQEAKDVIEKGASRLTKEQLSRIKTQLSTAKNSNAFQSKSVGGQLSRQLTLRRQAKQKKQINLKRNESRDGGPFHSKSLMNAEEPNDILSLYNAGRFIEARNAAENLTQRQPYNAFGWKTLTTIYLTLDRTEDALAAATQAAFVAPNDAEAQNNYGVVLKNLNRLPQANEAFDKAIALDPCVARYYYNKATLNQACGDIDSAEKNYRKAIELDHAFSEAYNNLGIIQTNNCQIEEAIASFCSAILENSNNAEAYYNYGIALTKKESFQDAESQCRKAMSIRENYIDAYKQLALIKEKQFLYRDAEEILKAAIVLAPTDDNLYYRLGNIFTKSGQNSSAENMFRNSISLNKNNYEAFCRLGDILFDQNQTSEAKQKYLKSIEINNSYSIACNNLGILLLEEGSIEEALSYYDRALKIEPSFLDCLSNHIFGMNYSPSFKAEEILNKAASYRNHSFVSLRREESKKSIVNRSKRISIGFVSGDFRTHPVAYFLLGFLGAMSREKFHIQGYYNNDLDDIFTERLMSGFDEWVNIFGLTDHEATEVIRDKSTQILVDLSGHTAKNRLGIFARKASPVQISWLGYCGTTGLKEIDYIIGDSYVTPVVEEHHFVEKVWRLPETYWCFAPPEHELKVEDLPANHNGYISFGCFNNLAKLNNDVIRIWALILKACANSKLFLKTRRLSDKQTAAKFREKFAQFGIGDSQLIIEGPSSRQDYLETYNRIDIALDPFPFPGGTTSIEGLWMGVPFITKKGDRFYSHNGETILHNIGLPEWIAADEDDYVRKAIEFSKDVDALAKLRKGLRDQILASPLFDAERFARNFEKAMFDIWEIHCSEQAQK